MAERATDQDCLVPLVTLAAQPTDFHAQPGPVQR